MTLADIMVVMNGGQVEQIGNPLAIYQKPATTFVASFIGAPPMNLMPLRDSGVGAQAPGESILGVRPEDIVISTETPANGLTLNLTVMATDRAGAEPYVYGVLSSQGDALTFTPKPSE